MEIAVLNYTCGEVEIYTNLPDEWEAEEIANYLHDELGLDEDSTVFMAAQGINIEFHKRR